MAGAVLPGAPARTGEQVISWLFAGHVLGDLSHLLRPGPGLKGLAGYRRAVRQPVSPQVPAIVTGWVALHWPGTAAGGEDLG